MTGVLQFVDLESVLKELKPGAIIQYVARNGTIQEVVFVGYEDWRAALAQVGQSAIDTRVAKDEAVRDARAAIQNAQGAQRSVDQFRQQITEHGVQVGQRVDDLRDWVTNLYTRAAARDTRLVNRIKDIETMTTWLGIGWFVLLAIIVIIGAT